MINNGVITRIRRLRKVYYLHWDKILKGKHVYTLSNSQIEANIAFVTKLMIKRFEKIMEEIGYSKFIDCFGEPIYDVVVGKRRGE